MRLPEENRCCNAFGWLMCGSRFNIPKALTASLYFQHPRPKCLSLSRLSFVVLSPVRRTIA
jgi:hypothetical protein